MNCVTHPIISRLYQVRPRLSKCSLQLCFHRGGMYMLYECCVMEAERMGLLCSLMESLAREAPHRLHVLVVVTASIP
jgi:hypothetical protein